MSTVYTVPTFGGLNLISDPEETGASGAVDLLNVDLDKNGRLRTRDGYTSILSVAAAGALDTITPYYKTDGTKHILTSTETTGLLSAYTSAGVSIATQAFGGGNCVDADFARFGGPGAEVAYAVSWLNDPTQTNTSYKWTGAAWAVATLQVGGAGAYPFAVEVKADDNRLVAAYLEDKGSKVAFSDPGVPETIGANNYVDLTPGDGERITALVSWRELVFAFKETKFFVFGTTSTSGTGTPVFNYRPVDSGVGTITRHAAVAAPRGVYFLSRRGIYLTTGGDPILVSRVIDPIFRGGADATFLSSVLNHAALTKCALTWHDERLYFAYPSGSSTTNDRLLVHDPEAGTWILWNIAANGLTSFRVGDELNLLFTFATGAHDIGQQARTFTDDDGTAIAARYQSGFYQPAPGKQTSTRLTTLWGTGTPTFDIFTDHATSDPLTRGGTVTLGTSPAVAKGYHLKAYTGDFFSHKISSTSGAWSVNRLELDIANEYTPQ